MCCGCSKLTQSRKGTAAYDGLEVYTLYPPYDLNEKLESIKLSFPTLYIMDLTVTIKQLSNGSLIHTMNAIRVTSSTGSDLTS